jgi:hypothetical protein
MSKVWKEKSKNEFTSKKEIFFLSFPKTQSILFFFGFFVSLKHTIFFFHTLQLFFSLLSFSGLWLWVEECVFWLFDLVSTPKFSQNFKKFLSCNKKSVDFTKTYHICVFVFSLWANFSFFLQAAKRKRRFKGKKTNLFFPFFLSQTHTHTPNVVIFFWWVFWYTKTLFHSFKKPSWKKNVKSETNWR